MTSTVLLQPVFEIRGEFARIHALQSVCDERLSAAVDRLCIFESLREAAVRPASMKIVMAVQASTIAADPDFFPFLEWSSRAHEVAIDRIVIGVSRCGLLSSHRSFCEGIQRLRAGGVAIALEEIGSAYSNILVALRLLPDYIKVDRSVVSGVDRDPAREDALRSIVDLASQCGARVIAEGVEVRAEFLAVRDAGIELMSGSFLAPPREGRFEADDEPGSFM